MIRLGGGPKVTVQGSKTPIFDCWKLVLLTINSSDPKEPILNFVSTGKGNEFKMKQNLPQVAKILNLAQV